ncbi:type I-E CRISPR-associated protein Cse1/CasA [Thioclava sp. GXIMD4215]|uniref:type I-E CRISPR-associated protein Cse1/CasA n=1 Tax=Thioclava sp. GXIMD4215 TaxID=3131928 RepID=UPI00324BFF0C
MIFRTADMRCVFVSNFLRFDACDCYQSFNLRFGDQMSLNLIEEAWIPVRMVDGTRRVIAPWQMADPHIAAPDWPRADLNLACYEFLIGLVFMACPPEDLDDWVDARPDADQLRRAFAPFASAFNLLGEGPRFLQDLEELSGEPSSPDLLFIDSAGESTERKNADLMVHRDRYAILDLPSAAMALYAFQQFAPAGGRGNRTSLRGGGPMVTLADPGQGLWALVWANVPFGQAAGLQDLPWMRPTITSETNLLIHHTDSTPVEAFFGMPRRLKLVGQNTVTGVVQRPNGTNYGIWRHPLSPYSRLKPGDDPLPQHPKSGRLPWRNWAGIVLSEPPREGSLRLRARCIEGYSDRHGVQPRRMIVAGWAMSKATPIDFLWAELPLLAIDPEAQELAQDLIVSANDIRLELGKALGLILSEGSAREAQADQFWAATTDDFTAALAKLAGRDPKIALDRAAIAGPFVVALGRQALAQFDALALPGLSEGRAERAAALIRQRGLLSALIHGRSKPGAKLWLKLGLTPPETKRKETV